MLETKSNGNTNPNSTLIALKPRQVMLAELNTKMTTTTKKKDHKKTLTLKPDQKALLLHSVLRYVERNGYSKTLKRFLSEAEIENDSWKACSLDLEDMYCKYLETCSHADTNLSTYKEKELQMDGMTKIDGDSNCAAPERTASKKKKKKSDENNRNTDADQSGASDKLTESAKNSKGTLANDMVTEANVKSKEKKKRKKISDSLDQTEQVSSEKEKKKSDNLSDSPDQTEQVNSEALQKPAEAVVSELQMNESTKKHKDKKKKKSNVISESLDGNLEQEQLDSLPGITEEKSKDSEAKAKTKDKKKKNKPGTISVVENIEQCGLKDKQGLIADQLVSSALENTSDIQLEKKKVVSKDKKRKKEGSVCERLFGGVGVVVDKESPITIDSTKECFQISEDVTTKEKKGSKKRKRLASDGNEYQPAEEVAVEESKRRKTEGMEESKSSEQTTKVDAIPGGDGRAGEENKEENGQIGCKESTFFKQLDEHANGKLEKNGGEKSAAQKTIRKQCNGSAEPKTVNAFQRVRVDEVVFPDERLQDNSYWAKDGAEIGYGAKAQEVLGQVRGRDFRHEKTKKKRGSYRGGQIDLQSHSVKFNYSDED
uniref:Srp40 C-terminal domain-containing protein n=2 Tax=Davidia involucrata TaxID=16924 RepID=A0A5B7A6G3_DAVIN